MVLPLRLRGGAAHSVAGAGAHLPTSPDLATSGRVRLCGVEESEGVGAGEREKWCEGPEREGQKSIGEGRALIGWLHASRAVDMIIGE